MPAAAQHLPDASVPDKSVDLNVRQCAGCGLIQLDGPPVPYYREVIRAAAFSPEMGEFRRAQLRDWLTRYNLRRVLECGCGRGEYLRLLDGTGIDAHGVEFGENSVQHCRADGLKVEKLYWETGKEMHPAAPFDGFFILNYLEHLPNINEYLRGIAGNLREGGTGLVEVPNFDMILANNTFAEFTTDHLYYFTEKTLASTMERNGFDVLASRTLWYGYILSMEVRKRPAANFSGFESAREKLAKQLNALVDQYGVADSAVWGASHQAFAVLALAGLHKKLRCVIDSAPFKQGKLTPATHIPIVAPESIKPGELKLLIVIAGGYSTEVAKLARQRFGRDFPIYVLRENELEHLTHMEG